MTFAMARPSVRTYPPPPSSMVKFDIGNILQKNSQETLHTVKIRQQYRALYIPIYVGYLLLTSVRNTL